VFGVTSNSHLKFNCFLSVIVAEKGSGKGSEGGNGGGGGHQRQAGRVGVLRKPAAVQAQQTVCRRVSEVW